MSIKSPADLRIAIQLYLEGDKTICYDIYKYKWYNYYQNIHIKQGSEADVQNEQIFEEIKLTHPKLHQEVEEYIDHEIARLNSGATDYD